MLPAKIQIRSFRQTDCDALTDAGANALLAKLYAARQACDPQELDDKLAGLIPFAELKNCEAAAVKLADALAAGKKMLIVADYDADGATACTVGVKGLQSMGAAVDFLVPNRFEHGYGLTPELAEIAAAQGAEVLITVDNGIASLSGVARAQELGLEVIVTDHHLPADEQPD
ncbi:MAG: DHH family phosphoesterase, partial [Neisseria sp.]|nr:DHH family phosphoesterase [Neisseria sp.]